MEQLVNFIIRPPRAEYSTEHDLLDQEFMLKGKWYQRKDIEVKNSRGDVLQCSHYVPLVSPEGKPLPCVIYCHGNSGCRADASEAAIILLPLNITVFTLDFSGSGLSGGEHVTLGWNEKDDLKAVVDYLRSDGNVSMIGLWGRSMGAVTSLMYGAEDPSIAGMVLDSPFSDLVDLMMELVDTYKVRLPKFTVKFAIQYMRKAILKKAKFDIMDLNTIKVAKSCFVPVLFGHAIDDDFIRPHHSERIFEVYMGDKNIIKFEGDHNSPRPQFYFDSISIFFKNVLQPPDDDVPVSFFDPMHEYIDKATWNALHGLGYAGSNSSDPVSSTSGDAIEQLRSKRQMSRMEVPPNMAAGDSQPESKVEVAGNESPSASGMINFELTNGQPHGPHVPISFDDDQYVEYPLDTLTDFPRDVEEEERMVMEAIMESLKDMKMSQPLEDTSSCASSNSTETRQENGKPSPWAADEDSRGPSQSNPTLISGTNASGSQASQSLHISNGCPPKALSLESSPQASSVKSDQLTNTSSTESADGTKAMVTVVKNSSGHIIDGLFKRWDRNFFRSTR
uniref:Serine aminopeptidase S33 domain-containing protein n=1 Tax=Opuntia streptacantha TaxID=393608 RepID=A0A7C9CVH6_OPUST